MQDAIFLRSEMLLGNEAMERIAQKRVIIFGVGGVGSWCAEGLVRSGIRQLTIVDFDSVDVTNVNRQLMATTKTVGQVKVDALKERLLHSGRFHPPPFAGAQRGLTLLCPSQRRHVWAEDHSKS